MNVKKFWLTYLLSFFLPILCCNVWAHEELPVTAGVHGSAEKSAVRFAGAFLSMFTRHKMNLVYPLAFYNEKGQAVEIVQRLISELLPAGISRWLLILTSPEWVPSMAIPPDWFFQTPLYPLLMIRYLGLARL